jgi:hypothetical protein
VSRFLKLPFALVFAGTVFMAGWTSADAVAQRQPHLRSALKALKQARKLLTEATPHYDGHRARALAMTEQAINETKESIEFALAH